MLQRMCFLLTLVIALTLASCQSAGPQPATITTTSPSSEETSRDSAQLAYQVAEHTWSTNDDAYSLVLLMVKGEDKCKSFDQRAEILEAKGIACANWNLQPGDPVTKGTVAYMLCEVLDMKDSVMLRLIPSRRYAYREAVYRGLMLRGSEYEPLTGPELIGIVSRAARPQVRYGVEQ